jgi:hypothetical protein
MKKLGGPDWKALQQKQSKFKLAELKTIDAFPQLKNKGYVTARAFMQP